MDMKSLVIAVAALSFVTGSADAQDLGNPAHGRAFALEVCTPCHVVARGQRSPARFADAPSFSAIADAKGTTASSLNAFLSTPHPTMPNLILKPDEAADVIGYILSLRGKQ
ncbi:MAG TPA: hypothetical protein VLV50_11775 [Stellaceae bacterium]|nr:hypothetical protein [Stellaceae bacterium]